MQEIDLEKVRVAIEGVSKYSHKKPFLADEDKMIDIITEYNNGISITSLSKKHDIKGDIISTWLKRCGVTVRTRENKLLHKYDISYFNEIDTEKKAYFLGFIVADGCNYKGLCIRIQTEDEYILQELLKDMKSTLKIDRFEPVKEHHKSTSRIRIKSKVISESLSKLGVVPRKSDKTYFPHIPENLYSHFIRGLFDGDGCISIDKKSKQKRIQFTGHISLIERIQEILIKECSLNKTKIDITISKSGKKSYTIHYVGNNQIERITNYLYDEATIYLTRKFNKCYKNSNIWIQELM
jgi:intein/homing endonuclease